jgi:predicted nucleic acid-binding protein
VDASVALKWFLPESGNSEAETLLTAFLIGTVSLYAPDLPLIEAASALWRRSVVLKELASSDAKAIYRDLLTLPLNFQPSERRLRPPSRWRLHIAIPRTIPFTAPWRLKWIASSSRRTVTLWRS